MIYVTVGTMFMDFPRLIRKMDAIASDTREHIIVQIGLGSTLPEHCEHFRFRPREDVLALQREARVIVSHAGIGSVLDAMEAGRPLIVVPRRKKFREHVTEHQMEVAEAVQRRGWGRMVLDIEELAGACANPPQPAARHVPSRHRLIGAVREMIERVAASQQLAQQRQVK